MIELKRTTLYNCHLKLNAQMMPVGSKWELVIPSELAYGKQGKGRSIAGDAVLCFEVELLGINDKPAGKALPGGK